MKKVALLFSAVVLFAGLTFSQTPQTQSKAPKSGAKTETVTKDSKAGCDMKTKAACSEGKKTSGCCAKDGKKVDPKTTAPEKK